MKHLTSEIILKARTGELAIHKKKKFSYKHAHIGRITFETVTTECQRPIGGPIGYRHY